MNSHALIRKQWHMVQQRDNVKSAGHYSRINPNMVIKAPVGGIMTLIALPIIQEIDK